MAGGVLRVISRSSASRGHELGEWASDQLHCLSLSFFLSEVRFHAWERHMSVY